MWMIWGSLVSFGLLLIGLEYNFYFIINLVCFNMICIAGIQLLSGIALLFIQDEVKNYNLYALRVLSDKFTSNSINILICIIFAIQGLFFILPYVLIGVYLFVLYINTYLFQKTL